MAYQQYMHWAIELAKRGFGSVEPNPLVGCVIVNPEGEVVGEGWHKQFGKEHAEINALQDCRLKGLSPSGCSVYVTLEPCSHYGKTPPCAAALIEAEVAEVIAAMEDPSEKVAGRGFNMLRKAGIKVEAGVCREQAELLNPAFIKQSRHSRPWVILKWAQSIDGYMSETSPEGQDLWLTSEASRENVHRLRRSCDYILAGIGTVLTDDPLLTARPSHGRSPHRIILDSKLRITADMRVSQSIDAAPLTIFTLSEDQEKIQTLTDCGVNVVQAQRDENGRCSIRGVLDKLAAKNAQRVMVEAGPELLTEFIRCGLADELWIYTAPKMLCSAGKDSLPKAMAGLPGSGLYHSQFTPFGEDIRLTALTRPVSEI
ncbi:bifunctional diaminohydroxyphosphoribosylaminopyrimidine deaminase/5-amino-6-(5-phosphoribosylamino)uracil reductase RibD [Sedimentisphaera salicampi]|uniref:bifunctional diaminohydroxyphosphoribosylaminopyrimidine deaminase/5-amino-6-(5-phosphoribosylamino)uracil reductase RibD n=1 Tax=Sedimentisphaera salicampi TaxID=1941349 RepID=UPI000B9B4006|nr:bifunctional diaminohydroxyphosphoribosylaminopyrimidine deaminase/5-amino-6-(5-phosphoribosylamino)uracil reductase RibD [Sedimentisphaera salicampi]OXU14722.1 Riboflavin biosynthesis protein RibD [Sedimentisphaera salicampi]